MNTMQTVVIRYYLGFCHKTVILDVVGIQSLVQFVLRSDKTIHILTKINLNNLGYFVSNRVAFSELTEEQKKIFYDTANQHEKVKIMAYNMNH